VTNIKQAYLTLITAKALYLRGENPYEAVGDTTAYLTPAITQLITIWRRKYDS